MELSTQRPLDGSGLLYPMMVIAALAVIVFSVLGIASLTGWMPSSLLSRTVAAPIQQEVDTARSGVTFECAECGVIESIRELERQSTQAKALRAQFAEASVLARYSILAEVFATAERAALAPLFLLLLFAGCASDAPVKAPAAGPSTTPPAAASAPARKAAAPATRYNLTGYSAGFREGYSDACAKPRRRNEQRFKADSQYMMGWSDGSTMCR